MRLHRFYVKQPLGEELVVDNRDLIHQWTSVFRFKPGDKILLFSSSPNDFLYQFSALSKKEASLSFVENLPNASIKKDVALHMALVKKDTFETVVRQATELGITRIVPILAERSEKKGLNFERLEAILKEATEQSGRGDLPAITQILPIDEAVSGVRGEKNIVGSLHGEIFHKQIVDSHDAFNVWIGPEGGWTKEEEDLFSKSGFSLVRFAETTLKADTAATSLISLALAP